MIYLKKEIAGSRLLGIWKVEESIDDLLAKLSHKEWLINFDRARSLERKKEILATRVLLKELLGEEKEICYHDSGKPYLKDNSYQLSISHTRGYVAVVLDSTHVVGLDIEQRTNKIFKVRDRLISNTEYIDLEQEQVHLLLHWSAKEAMFKYLNLEGVDFRGNLHVVPFTPQKQGVFEVSESKTEQGQSFRAHYLVHEDFVLVCLEDI